MNEVLSRNVITGIRCQDIQTGLQNCTVHEFETLLKVGMAARLAVHIRGGDAIRYQSLKEYAALLFDIDKLVFEAVVRILQEVQFVRVIGTGTSKVIVPTVPYFDDMYEGLGAIARSEGLNELEQISIELLNRLAASPQQTTQVVTALGVDQGALDRVVRIGSAGSYINEFDVKGAKLLVSPLYFAEKPEEFARVVKQYGEVTVARVFSLFRGNQGWPLVKLVEQKQIGDAKLNKDEFEIARAIIDKGLVQPPEITTSYSGTNEFLFTPPLGTKQIVVVEKEIYEKAMACISCVRQGEHFGQWNIKWPRAIINALLNTGELRPTSIAKEQYRAMRVRGIIRLAKAGSWWKPVLVDTPENRRSLLLALEMLGGGEFLSDRGYDSDAAKAIYSDSDYTEAIRGYGNVVRRKRIKRPQEEFSDEIDKILFAVQKGV